jgi:hypothetical protein
MGSDKQRGVIVQGLDILDVLKFNIRKNKRFQAEFLQGVEKVLPTNSKEFKEIRKLYLDISNEYMRSSFRSIFGDIEYLLSRYD